MRCSPFWLYKNNKNNNQKEKKDAHLRGRKKKKRHCGGLHRGGLLCCAAVRFGLMVCIVCPTGAFCALEMGASDLGRARVALRPRTALVIKMFLTQKY